MKTEPFTSPGATGLRASPLRRPTLPAVRVRALIALAALCTPLASRVRGDAVTDWNAIMQTTVASGNANVQARSGAIVQLAVFEAVNAILGDYEPYLGTIGAPDWASPEAAVAAAAHRTLVALHPAGAATLEARRAASLGAIPDGPAKEAGIAAGEAAAAAMLMHRLNDGSAQAGSAPYTPGTEVGDWQPAPPAFAPAFLPGWGEVTPFGLEAGSQFRLPPPPSLKSGRYARDYDEVKLVGSINADSQTRPPDRTDVARFFAVTSPVQAWNPAARQVSAAQGKTLSENGRVFALLAMAICDASIAAYETKYHYNTWRPLTAIWSGGIDGNRKTNPDGEWFPLIATPAFPGYPSAHATLSGAARAVLERVFGKHGHAITLANPDRLPGVVLNYTEWSQICDDIDDARVYGGIHFRFEQDAGAHQGLQVGRFIFKNHLRPTRDEGESCDDE